MKVYLFEEPHSHQPNCWLVANINILIEIFEFYRLPFSGVDLLINGVLSKPLLPSAKA
jgi:hypothetical protein